MKASVLVLLGMALVDGAVYLLAGIPWAMMVVGVMSIVIGIGVALDDAKADQSNELPGRTDAPR